MSRRGDRDDRDDRGAQRVSLLIRNLPLDARPEDVRAKFERYGEVRDIYLPRDYYTNRPRGFGFIEFKDNRDAEDALYHLDRSNFMGREISVVMSKESRKTPRDMIQRERAYTGGSRGGSGHDRGYDRGRDYDRGGRDRDRYRGRSRSPRRRSRSRSPARENSRRGRSPSRSRSPPRDSHRRRSSSRSPAGDSPRRYEDEDRGRSPAPREYDEDRGAYHDDDQRRRTPDEAPVDNGYDNGDEGGYRDNDNGYGDDEGRRSDDDDR